MQTCWVCLGLPACQRVEFSNCQSDLTIREKSKIDCLVFFSVMDDLVWPDWLPSIHLVFQDFSNHLSNAWKRAEPSESTLSALENILLIVPLCWSLSCLIRDVSLQDSLRRSSIIKSSITGSWKLPICAVSTHGPVWNRKLTSQRCCCEFLGSIGLKSSCSELQREKKVQNSSRSLCVVLEARWKHTIYGGMICYLRTILEKTLNFICIIFQRQIRCTFVGNQSLTVCDNNLHFARVSVIWKISIDL